MRYLGLDLHKHYVHGYVFQAGQKGTHFRFPNTPDGWQRFVATQVTPDTAIALEATGNAFAIYDALAAAGRVGGGHAAGLASVRPLDGVMGQSAAHAAGAGPSALCSLSIITRHTPRAISC